MSQPHGSKSNASLASVDTPELDADERRAQQMRRRIQNRRDRHHARLQLHDAARLGVKRLVAA